MNHDDPGPDLERLLMELVDGELTPAQRLRLMDLLREDLAAHERYAEYACLDSLLAWEISMAEEDPRGGVERSGRPFAHPEATRADVSARPWGRTPGSRAWTVRARWAGAVAVLLVLLGLVRWRMPALRRTAVAQAGGAPAGDLAKEPRIGGLAILTRAVDVLWEPGGSTPVVDSVLSQGVLRFRSGVVQIEFHSGATVIVEGPAEIELKAIDRIACRWEAARAGPALRRWLPGRLRLGGTGRPGHRVRDARRPRPAGRGARLQRQGGAAEVRSPTRPGR